MVNQSFHWLAQFIGHILAFISPISIAFDNIKKKKKSLEKSRGESEVRCCGEFVSNKLQLTLQLVECAGSAFEVIHHCNLL